MTVSPISFDECNKRLLARDMYMDISEYISLTHTITFNSSVSHRLSEIASLIHFMNEIMSLHPHDFAISLTSIERLGFFVTDTFRNHIRNLCKAQKKRLENQLSFLRKHKLKANVDYEMSKFRISGMDSELDVEYKITTLAFYKLLNNKYDNMFLTLLNARIFQINAHYNRYISAYYNNKISNLTNTINGLTEDIGKLVVEHPSIKKSIVFNDDNNSISEKCELNGCQKDKCDCFRDSYISLQSDVERISLSSHPDTPIFDEHIVSYPYKGNSPITAILESPRFSDEIAQIHSKLLNIVSSPHESLDILKSKFNSDTESDCASNRISIPKSMIGDGIDYNHVNMLRKRFSIYLNSSSEKLQRLRCTPA